MSRRMTALLVAGGVAAFAVPASAHVQLKAPLQRYADLKDGPCGRPGGSRTTNVCTFRPGATIMVVWDETIDHPGHFRISFDDDGDDDFVDPAGYDDLYTGESVLLDDIADRDVGDGDSTYRREVTLPDVECDNCTLQVIQVMTDKTPYGDGNDLSNGPQCTSLDERFQGTTVPPRSGSLRRLIRRYAQDPPAKLSTRMSFTEPIDFYVCDCVGVPQQSQANR